MSEFSHYTGCRLRDPDNCSGCALTTGGEEGPNYAAWPLSYIQSGIRIPDKWIPSLVKQMGQVDNIPYADNVKKHVLGDKELTERVKKYVEYPSKQTGLLRSLYQC